MNRTPMLKAGGRDESVGLALTMHARDTIMKDMRLVPECQKFGSLARQMACAYLGVPFRHEVRSETRPEHPMPEYPKRIRAMPAQHRICNR